MNKISIRYLKGVGPRKEEVFNKKAGIYTVENLLYYFPFRYEDRTNFVAIKDLREGEASAVEAKVLTRNLKKFPYFLKARKIKSIFEVILEDNSGRINCTWFNQAYLSEVIEAGQKLVIYGKPSRYKGRLQIVSPRFECCGGQELSDVGKIIPIYKTPSEFSQRYLRKTIALAVKQYHHKFLDPLPFNVRKKQNIPNIAESFEKIHFPSSLEEADSARQRFIFEELFISQIMVYLRKAKHRLQKGPSLDIDPELVKQIEKTFPFQLTPAQKNSLNQILPDLEKSYPMHRLLQGDVGSGKTAVAIFPILLSAIAGWQSAFMVPTEVLAYQHKQTLDSFLESAGHPLNRLKGRVELITSSLSSKERSLALNHLKSGSSLIAVGTHSLIQKKIEFKRLGMVVIDEQHKFGVAQRAFLPRKGQIPPNCLVMSATPIPRSLALSLYGDLDLSVINQLPSNRARPETILVDEESRAKVYNFIRKKVKEGKQVYIVYPVIDADNGLEVKALNKMYKKIQSEFKGINLGIFHGRLKNEEKIRAIERFRKKEIDILVSTNVVEVGLDIKNATVMVVESPQKFGLSQLHQLRGRIQRSKDKATFILVSGKGISPEAEERLKAIVEENDGFKIAEKDLRLRGPGDFFGQLQHGLPNLKIAEPLRDLKILSQARQYAKEVIEDDPHLGKPPLKPLRDRLRSRGVN